MHRAPSQPSLPKPNISNSNAFLHALTPVLGAQICPKVLGALADYGILDALRMTHFVGRDFAVGSHCMFMVKTTAGPASVLQRCSPTRPRCLKTVKIERPVLSSLMLTPSFKSDSKNQYLPLMPSLFCSQCQEHLSIVNACTMVHSVACVWASKYPGIATIAVVCRGLEHTMAYHFTHRHRMQQICCTLAFGPCQLAAL